MHKRYRLRRWLKPAVQDMRRHPQHVAWHLRLFLERRSDHWYRALFTPQSQQIAGEITPTYAILSQEKIANLILRVSFQTSS